MRPLKRLVALVLTVGVGAGALTAVAVAPAIAGSTATTPTVTLKKFGNGKILSHHGSVLYMFTHDKKNQNSCMKISGCKSIWPAFTVAGKPTAGPGVNKSLLGTIKIAGGKHQVTYAGHALYRYSLDPKTTSYIGTPEFGGNWDALNAAGKSVTKP